MKRYYIFRDGKQEANTATREAAIDLIREYQKQETHPFLKASFSIIVGEEEFIPYPTTQRTQKKKSDMER